MRHLWGNRGMVLALLLGLTLPVTSLARTHQATQKNAAKPSTPTKFRPEDVMATVEGEKITRRELVYYWLQSDTRTASVLGSLLAEKWRKSSGSATSYTVALEEIYERLFTSKDMLFDNTLSNMVTNRLVSIEAKKRNLLVTKTEVDKYTTDLLRQVKQQRGLTVTDEEFLKMFKVPRDLFFQDMRFRVQLERLLRDDVARRNGHRIGPDDWLVVRELFAAARVSGEADQEAQFTSAKKRIEGWLKEVQGGKSMEEVARERNEDFTRSYGGLRGPALRGTGSKGLEDAIWALKPGELSVPLRGRSGWFIFKVERRGNEINAAEREQMWKQIVEARTPGFLTELRRAAKTTSIIPLPLNPPTPSNTSLIGEDPDMPPPPPGP